MVKFDGKDILDFVSLKKDFQDTHIYFPSKTFAETFLREMMLPIPILRYSSMHIFILIISLSGPVVKTSVFI